MRPVRTRAVEIDGARPLPRSAAPYGGQVTARRPTRDSPDSPTDRTQWCRQVCLGLPDATADHPFGAGSEVLRVHRKMFALLWQVPRISEHPMVNLKADPDEVPLLVSTHAWVLPGYHMNKKHWISVELRPDADLDFVEGLIEDSYDNVVLGLPARLRPALRGATPQPLDRPVLGAPAPAREMPDAGRP